MCVATVFKPVRLHICSNLTDRSISLFWWQNRNKRKIYRMQAKFIKINLTKVYGKMYWFMQCLFQKNFKLHLLYVQYSKSKISCVMPYVLKLQPWFTFNIGLVFLPVAFTWNSRFAFFILFSLLQIIIHFFPF